MSKPKIQVDSDLIDYANDQSQTAAALERVMQRARKFNIGDYLICYEVNIIDFNSNAVTRSVLYNSYGAPQKYIVSHVSPEGFGYIQKLDNKGKPTNELLSLVSQDMELDTDEFSASTYSWFEFELDPDYADAVIMNDVDNYDPMRQHKERAVVFKDITEHNKKHKVPTKDLNQLNEYFKNLTVGTTLWTSAKKSLTVTSVDVINYNQLPLAVKCYFKKGDKVAVVHMTNGKRTRRVITAVDFQSKALYTVQPRTYNKSQDPIL